MEERAVDEAREVAARVVNAAQVVRELGQVLLCRVLDQHLGIAENDADGRAQLLPHGGDDPPPDLGIPIA